MKKIMSTTGPNYKLIYSDMIRIKYPERKQSCQSYLDKKNLTVMDVIELNKKIFGKNIKETEDFNQRHRSYNRSAIFEILDFQKKNGMNNSQVAIHFKLSRNTIAKWKKLFF